MDPQLTCFEPETCGNLIEGLDFHRFYFDNGIPSLVLVWGGPVKCRIQSAVNKSFSTLMHYSVQDIFMVETF